MIAIDLMAPTLTPVYAGLGGLAMGAISSVFEAQYSGLVSQAVRSPLFASTGHRTDPIY